MGMCIISQPLAGHVRSFEFQRQLRFKHHMCAIFFLKSSLFKTQLALHQQVPPPVMVNMLRVRDSCVCACVCVYVCVNV